MTYYLRRDDEIAVTEEAQYGTSPGDPVAGDFFRFKSGEIVHEEAEAVRDQEMQYGSASVSEIYTGREKSTLSIETYMVPSGVTGTPTAPDVHSMIKAAMGSAATRTAHTTTTSGSSGTSLVLTTGGGAASGVAIGDLIAVDVSSDYGLEVRRVTNVATDTVTVDRAFSDDPATGRDVYVGTTYRLSESDLLSLQFWLFNGSARRWQIPGAMINEMELTADFREDVPMGNIKFSGEAKHRIAQTVTKPTATTAGTVLVPSTGKVWIGATSYPILSATLNVKNGIELRNNESTGLYPTGVKRTGNNSRYDVQQTIEMYLTSDTESGSLDSGGDSRTARDTIVQLGASVGNIVAWCTPNWRPKSEDMEQDGEIGLRLTGRALATAADDEVFLAFL